jgi:Leucine rich repeat
MARGCRQDSQVGSRSLRLMGVDAKTTMGAPSRSELVPRIGFENRPEARTELTLSASGTTPEARSLTGLTERKQTRNEPANLSSHEHTSAFLQQSAPANALAEIARQLRHIDSKTTPGVREKADYSINTTVIASGEPTTLHLSTHGSQPGAFRVKPGVVPMLVIPATQEGSVFSTPHPHSPSLATPSGADDTGDLIIPATLVLTIDNNDRLLFSGELNIPRATEIDAANTVQFVRPRRAAVFVAVVTAGMLAVLLSCILFNKETHQLSPSHRQISVKEFVSWAWPADAPDPGSPQGLALSWLASDIRDATMIAWRMRQRYTLAVLYFSLNGKWWLNNTDWLSSHHECLWYSDRQQCDSNDHWIILSMPRNNVSGTLPQDLGYLSHLEQIWLENNVIWGRIPKEAASLARLEVLSLAENALSGSMPTEIGMLRSLEYLQLSYNRLSGQIPTAIGRLTNLRSLDMSHNAFTGTVGFLSSGLEKSRLKDAPELGFLPNLSDIFLRENMLTGTIPHEISRLANLYQVDFSGNALTGPIPSELYVRIKLACVLFRSRQVAQKVVSMVSHISDFFNEGRSFRC